MLKQTIAAAVAAAMLGAGGVAIAAKGGNPGGGVGAGVGGGHGHVNMNSNAPSTLDHDRGQARAAERHTMHSAPALPAAKVKPNRVQTSATTKITPHKASKRTTTNTRYHSQVRNPIPRVNNAPDFRASREQRMQDAYNRWLVARR